MAGELMSWVFIVAVAFLSGFGIFFGRILRLNSWDILMPWKLFHTVGAWATQSSAYSGSILFSLLFAAFLIVTSPMPYPLPHLSPPHSNSLPPAHYPDLPC